MRAGIALVVAAAVGGCQAPGSHGYPGDNGRLDFYWGERSAPFCAGGAHVPVHVANPKDGSPASFASVRSSYPEVAVAEKFEQGLENLAVYTGGAGQATITLLDENDTPLDSFSHDVVSPTSVQLDTKPSPTVLRGAIVHVRAAADDCIGWYAVRANAVGATELPAYERNDSTDFAFVVSAPSAKLEFSAYGAQADLSVSSVSLDDLTSIELHSAGNRSYQLVLGNVYAGTTPVAGALCNWSTSDGDKQPAPSPAEVWLADGPQVAWEGPSRKHDVVVTCTIGNLSASITAPGAPDT